MYNKPWIPWMLRACLLTGLPGVTSCQKVTLYEYEPQMLELQGDLGVHDPVIIREGDMFYVFCTGGSLSRGGHIPIRCSRDLIHWSRCGSVFDELPQWCAQEIPGTRNPWAPDISFFNGKYHVYYSMSTFGKNNSAIGLATNVTLDPNNPDYQWEDQGMVIRSTAGKTDWNAIDGNIIVEKNKRVWLSWGSFWGGIQLVRLDDRTGKLYAPDNPEIINIAARPRTGEHVEPPVTGAIEAPFIVRHGKYYYQFVSFDFCCRGPDSTYKVMVGRSTSVTGPYRDRDGKLMTDGGGSLVIEASAGGFWKGPGHCAVIQDVSGDYLVFHAYRGARERGKPQSELKISTMVWEDGWPRVGELP
jgi:arabinan endo-1,5-alpha-L-arabinosidase